MRYNIIVALALFLEMRKEFKVNGQKSKRQRMWQGICQRKDGLYTARFVNKRGVRQEKFFSTIPEARNWLDDARYADKHDNVFVPSDMTVNT